MAKKKTETKKSLADKAKAKAKHLSREHQEIMLFWRGSVRDLATDLVATLSEEQLVKLYSLLAPDLRRFVSAMEKTEEHINK